LIYAIMIVGPGEVERYLDPVVDRVLRWADGLHLALEPGAREEEMSFFNVDSIAYLKVSADENESMAKDEAWRDAVNAFCPTEDDLMAFVKPTEVILDPDAVRMAAREHKDETVFLPFRRGGSYPDYRLRAGRLPTYHFDFPYHGVSVTYMLDYDMMSFEDKLAKWEWFERVGASDFFSIDHIQSIQRTPTLRSWRKGGVLHVGEAVRRGNSRSTPIV